MEKMPTMGPTRHENKMPVVPQEKKYQRRVPLDTENENASGNFPKYKKMPEISENAGTYRCA